METDTLEVSLAPFGLSPEGEVNTAHATQEKILQWADDVIAGNFKGGIPVLYAQGGWRSGKTRAVLAIILECMEAYPGIRTLIGRKDFNDLRLSTMESWKEVRPRVLVKHEDKQEHREEWVNGSQVFFRELKDLEGLGGQEFGIILVSEPYELDRELYFRLKGRLSQAGMPHMLLLEGNPPNEGHWLHKLVMGDDHTNPDPDVTFFSVSTDENWDNLPESYRRSIETAPASWQKKYRLGQWGFTPEGQAVYDLFQESIHVRPVSLIPDRPLIRSWDSGARHPACLWAQTTPRGHCLIQYEWLGMETGLGVFSRGVVQRTNEWYGQKMVSDCGDPAMFARSPQTGKSDASLLKEEQNILLQGRPSTYAERKQLIDKYFGMLIDGVPAIQIHPRCRTLIEGLMGGFHYPLRKEGQAFSKKHETPFRDGFFEHLCNCFEYLMIHLYGQSSNVANRLISQKRKREALYRRQQTAVVF